VWFFESGTFREVLHLWQRVWCVEPGTVGDMKHLGREFLFENGTVV
jgi:hypothetical protein